MDRRSLVVLATLTVGLTSLVSTVGCGDDEKAGVDPTADTSAPTPDAADEDVAEDALEPDTAPPAPAWRHTGPITPGAAATVATPYFVELTEAVGLIDAALSGGRAMVVDLDGDGLDDLVTLPITVGDDAKMAPRFARNAGRDGGGQIVFEDVTAASGMADAEAAILVFADVDGDGDMDAFTGLSFRAAAGQLGIWLNDGDGHFTWHGASGLAPPTAGTASGGHTIYKEVAAAAFADFDGDGHLDLYLGHHYSGSPTTDGLFAPALDELYRGDGQGGFTLASLPPQTNPLTTQVEPGLAGVGRAAYGIALADFDDDGDMDVFVNNYGAGRPALGSPPRYWDHNLLWRNDGAMAFTDVGVVDEVAATERGIGGVQREEPVVLNGTTYPGPIGGNGFGCQWGDVDNDGDLDLVVGTIAHPDYPQSDRTMLHYNQGPGVTPRFTEESAKRGLEYYEDELHPALVDIDGDGRLDLAMSRLRGGSKWEVYLQDPDGSFVMASQEGSGVDITRPGPTVWLDYDGDGDLDFFMPQGGGRLFENAIGQDNRRLVLELVATAPRDATGARVTLTTSAGVQVREVTGGGGHYNTQSTRRLHFGLGGDSGAGDVTIRWPDGEVQELGDITADVTLRVTQGGAIELL